MAKKKIALITGVSGQDGAYLAKFLLNKNYKVIGSDRRSARNSQWRLKRLGIDNKIIYEELEMGELFDIDRLFKNYKFDEVYNLAAQSFVGSSFYSPLNTANITGLGVLRVLECIRTLSPKTKFYQASSSEMFGDVLEKIQNENTPFNPQSPYAAAKAFGHFLTLNYRKSYKLFAVSGILFNHESPLRGEEFVTRKIIIGFINILKKKKAFIELGNINAKRDWGYAKEYVEQMWKMLNQKIPRDFVIASGKTYSIKDFVNEVAKNLKMKVKWKGNGFNEKLYMKNNNKIIIKINKKLFRPSEVNYVKGNITKAKKYLNWKPKVTFKKLVEIMVKEELENLK